MLGSFDSDISSLLDANDQLELRDDLEIIEEYLGGVLLPPLVPPPAVAAVAEADIPFQDLSSAETAEAEDVATGEAAPPTFSTSTMAEIYVSQGFIQRAIDIYEEMLRDNPTNDALVQRIGELMDMLAPPAAAEEVPADVAFAAFAPEPVAVAPQGTGDVVSTLEQWLVNIKSSRRR